MAIMCLWAIWAFYIWLVQRCLRRSVVGMKIGGHIDRRTHDRVPDTVPSEWIKAYGAQNDA